MTTKQITVFFYHLLSQMKRRPLRWIFWGEILLLLHWTQPLIPYMGSILASIAATFIAAHLMDIPQGRRTASLVLLGILFFPMRGFWMIAMGLSMGSVLMSPFSFSMIFSILFVSALGELFLLMAISYTAGMNTSIDQALRKTWRQLTSNIYLWLMVATLCSVGWSIATLIGGGYGFLLIAPVSAQFLILFTQNSVSKLTGGANNW